MTAASRKQTPRQWLIEIAADGIADQSANGGLVTYQCGVSYALELMRICDDPMLHKCARYADSLKKSRAAEARFVNALHRATLRIIAEDYTND